MSEEKESRSIRPEPLQHDLLTGVVPDPFNARPAAEQAQIREAPASMLIPTWVLIGATIVFGLTTSLTVGVAHRAAAALLRVAP